MTPLEDRITELAAEYQSLIGTDHHKDRDCHFSIEQVWSYGSKPVYRVEHNGYIRCYSNAFSTRDDALRALVALLENYIREDEELEMSDDPA